MVVGWALADHMKTNLVIKALEMAVKRRRPQPAVIFYSDHGSSQYTSSVFAAYCEKHSMKTVRKATFPWIEQYSNKKKTLHTRVLDT